MEFMGWSNGVLGPEIMASTPVLQYSSTPTSILVEESGDGSKTQTICRGRRL